MFERFKQYLHNRKVKKAHEKELMMFDDSSHLLVYPALSIWVNIMIGDCEIVHATRYYIYIIFNHELYRFWNANKYHSWLCRCHKLNISTLTWSDWFDHEGFDKETKYKMHKKLNEFTLRSSFISLPIDWHDISDIPEIILERIGYNKKPANTEISLVSTVIESPKEYSRILDLSE